MLPSSPPLLIAADLAPIDTESFRSRYGQEALFRFDLGVGDAPPAPCDGTARAWAGSPRQRQMEAALAAGHWYEAGQALGLWQHEQRCAAVR
jgi:hypothetical protein